MQNTVKAAAKPANAQGEIVRNVRQGELDFCVGESDWISTLLGSSVALCLRDPFTGIGGLNHFLLPSAERGDDQSSTRYGSYAIEMLINKLMRAGADRRRMEGKIFGGGKMFETNGPGIGQMNIDFVRAFCDLEEIPLLSENVGGPFARKLQYQPISGRARVLKLGREVNAALGQKEQAFGGKLANAHLSGGAELFG